jgi:hypothetical protein
LSTCPTFSSSLVRNLLHSKARACKVLLLASHRVWVRHLLDSELTAHPDLVSSTTLTTSLAFLPVLLRRV